MIHKTYELVSQLPADAVLERVKSLLSKECVKYKVDNLSVMSTETPLVIVNFDPRLYTRANWVGVNPFAYVSGVDVRCAPGDNGLTKVIVRVNRFRSLLWVVFWVVNGGLVAFVMPEPEGAIRVILFVGFVCAAWFGNVSFLGSYLIKKEIGDHLKDGTRQRC
jgi:hypothetical protein